MIYIYKNFIFFGSKEKLPLKMFKKCNGGFSCISPKIL